MTKSHLHFVGIAGALMSGAAVLAKQLGHAVSGSDRNFAPPMGDLVRTLDAKLFFQYDDDLSARAADCYVIGNAVSRGNALVEAILSARCAYISAAQWVGQCVLADKKVLAVAGTHGKTTTASLLAYMLEQAGMQPGFLLGGIAQNFQTSARLAAGEWFVIEADEYDCAFFDKRPKFMHYCPHIALLNNLEYDHADIYDSVDDIVLQFHYLLRLLPKEGTAIVRANSAALQSAIDLGAYCPREYFGDDAEWRWEYHQGRMAVLHRGKAVGDFVSPLAGAANRDNIVGAFAAAAAAGVSHDKLASCVRGFVPPMRRLQKLYDKRGIIVYDDFAHHPSAYRATIAAVREVHPEHRLVVVFEPRSNTMKAGVLRARLAEAFADAARVIAVGTQEWLGESLLGVAGEVSVCASVDEALQLLGSEIRGDDCVVFMSNGDFGGLVQRVVGGFS